MTVFYVIKRKSFFPASSTNVWDEKSPISLLLEHFGDDNINLLQTAVALFFTCFISSFISNDCSVGAGRSVGLRGVREFCDVRGVSGIHRVCGVSGVRGVS